MGKDFIEFTELDDSGVVTELRVINHAEIPGLILDGEELKGAKQNRIVNISILLKENFETIIPVSCVEQENGLIPPEISKIRMKLHPTKLRNVKSTYIKRIKLKFW